MHDHEARVDIADQLCWRPEGSVHATALMYKLPIYMYRRGWRVLQHGRDSRSSNSWSLDPVGFLTSSEHFGRDDITTQTLFLRPRS